jgi:hypothetical protein
MEYDNLHKETANKTEKEAAEMAEKLEKAQKDFVLKATTAQIEERKARDEQAAVEAVKKSAEDKAAWEKKVEEKKRRAIAEFNADQQRIAKAAAEATKKAAGESAARERKVEYERKVKDERKAELVQGVEMAKWQLESERKREDELNPREKQTEAELRWKHIMIPWPSWM